MKLAPWRIVEMQRGYKNRRLYLLTTGEIADVDRMDELLGLGKGGFASRVQRLRGDLESDELYILGKVKTGPKPGAAEANASPEWRTLSRKPRHHRLSKVR